MIGSEELRFFSPRSRPPGDGLRSGWTLVCGHPVSSGDPGGYDAVVAMYHDQGIGAVEAGGLDTGVNWTLGLPFVGRRLIMERPTISRDAEWRVRTAWRRRSGWP